MTSHGVIKASPDQAGSRSTRLRWQGSTRGWTGLWHSLRVRAPAVQLSLWLHAALFLTLMAWPAAWRAVLGLLIGNHLFLAGGGMWPRSTLLGPNLVRLPRPCANRDHVAITFDDGPDPCVTPHVLDLMDRYGATASFFCIGERAARYPELVREIVRRGHSVENHTDRHPIAFACYGPRTLHREITRAQATLTAITGRPPRFFRAPFGLRSPLFDPALACTDLRYVSWTRRGYDRISRSPQRILRRLTRHLAAGDILLLHDGGANSDASGPVVLSVLPTLLEHLRDRGLRAVSLPMALDTDPDV